MVTLYVGGQKVAWADVEKLFSNSLTPPREIELRDEAGQVVARFVPETPSEDPDWVKAITPEEIERRRAEPFMTLDEFKKQQGWE